MVDTKKNFRNKNWLNLMFLGTFYSVQRCIKSEANVISAIFATHSINYMQFSASLQLCIAGISSLSTFEMFDSLFRGSQIAINY